MHKPKKTPARRFISLSLEAGILDAIDAWRERQEFIPTKTATLETALREFLERREKR